MVRLRYSIVLVSLLLLAILPPAALAANEWCDTDPAFIVRTPAGNLVPLYIDVGAHSEVYTPNTLLGALELSYSAVPVTRGRDRAAMTRVRFSVTVPSWLAARSFATRATVATGPLNTGTIYARVSGRSGHEMTGSFLIPSP